MILITAPSPPRTVDRRYGQSFAERTDPPQTAQTGLTIHLLSIAQEPTEEVRTPACRTAARPTHCSSYARSPAARARALCTAVPQYLSDEPLTRAVTTAWPHTSLQPPPAATAARWCAPGPGPARPQAHRPPPTPHPVTPPPTDTGRTPRHRQIRPSQTTKVLVGILRRAAAPGLAPARFGALES